MIALNQLAARIQTDEDGESASVCVFDGYPTNLDCVCGHDHGRHVGTVVRCMSYSGQPDCSCDAFVPSAESVQQLWEDARTLLSIVQSTC